MILKLKQIIDEKGITQAALAKATGIRPNTISVFCKEHAYKEGSNSAIGTELRSIPVDVLEKLCKELDVNVQDIIEFVPDRKSHRK